MKEFSNISVLLAGICTLIVGMGVARFSFTALLPNMLEDFLDIEKTGLMSSTNYLGYLVGAILASFLKNIRLKQIFLNIAFILCVVTTLILATSDNITLWLLSRLLAGIASAFLMVIGSAFVFEALSKKRKSSLMGIHFSGVGIGILFTGIMSDAVIYANGSWRYAFGSLCIFAMPLIIYSMYILNSISRDKTATTTQTDQKIQNLDLIKILVFTYFLEGIGFVVFATFLPDIINSLSGLKGVGKYVWYVVGLGAMSSTIIWVRLAHKKEYINIIIIALLLQAIAILIPVFSTSIFLNLASGFLYGSTMMGLTTLFMSYASQLAKNSTNIVMGALTAAYGVGQILAPLYCVKLYEIYKNYDAVLMLTAFFILVSMIILMITKIYQRRQNAVYQC